MTRAVQQLTAGNRQDPAVISVIDRPKPIHTASSRMDSSTPQELINPSRIDNTHASTLSTRSHLGAGATR